MPERTYSEDEVAAIFARAAERERADLSRDSQTGLTLADVEHAAREAGLNVVAVRAAAAEVDARGTGASPSRIVVAERWIEGTAEEGAWEDTVAALRQRFGAGTAWGEKETSSLGSAEEWTHSAASGVSTRVTLSPRGDRTLLRVQREAFGADDPRGLGYGLTALFSFPVAMLIGALIAEGLAMGDAAGIAAVVIAFALAMWLGGRWLTGRIIAERVRMVSETENLADDLARRLGEPMPPTAEAPAAPEAPGPMLDASLLDPPVDASPADSAKRRTRA